MSLRSRALLGTCLALAGFAGARAAEHPDVVLITIDTLRWDAVGWDGRVPSPTPRLDRLAAAGRVFPDAHAHNVVTLPSHTNILTGLYPFQHGVRDNSGYRLPPDVPTLATALHAAGYSTGAFVGAYPLDSLFGLDRGFDRYDDRFPKGGDAELALPERRGDEVVAAALAWWRQAPRPRFLWVHLFDPHAPYEPPAPFAARFAGEPYLGEVAAVDAFLTPLLDELALAPAGSLVAALTADHGEALGDHGELTHGIFAYESTLHVPLLLWGAGVAPGRDRRPARHVDLFPTLLAAADVAAPGWTSPRPGHSLLTAAAGSETSYFEALSAALHRGWAPLRGVIDRQRKLISLPLAELYDLDADPGETQNRIDERRPEALALAALLPPESSWPLPRTGSSQPPTAEEEARLNALGYLTGDAPAHSDYGPDDDPKRLRELDRRIFAALESYRSGEIARAVEEARAIVAERPAMAIGQSILAQALLEQGDRAGALAAMAAAEARGAATQGLRIQHGLTLVESGRAREAIALLEPLASRPEPRLLDALALAYADAGRAGDAETMLARALELDPEDPRAYQHRALLALRAARWGDARDAARRALALDPAIPLAWNDLGVALFQLGDRAGAIDAWQRAVELDPRLWDALWNLGTRAAAVGRGDLARRALETFAARAPHDRYAADIARARALLAALPPGPP